ncbi:hypothetical protein FCM35_KLT05064 [Carex littledalei]|uniref:Uncharacterized protein n=1 Tax=Carex littledalei TaxID=544730 RepID=A0A833QX51_9POAL|nr:hypothetical protein FCM35_KLT05064 [Carex littledalei]
MPTSQTQSHGSIMETSFALFTIYLLSSVLSRLPINSFDESCTPKIVDPVEDHKPECIELDSSEVPRFDESSSSTSSTEEQEKIMKELEEMDHEEFCRLLKRFGSVQSDGFMSFYEVLSFWRSKENLSRGKWHLD